MSRFPLSRSLLVACGVCALLVCGSAVQAQQYDNSPQPYDQSQDYANSDQSPGRVARLAYLSGQVQFAPAGESDWGSVEVNRPMVIGDRLLTGDDGRAVLELGDASVRIDNDTAFDFLNLTQNNVQVELSQGTLNLAVRQMAEGENFEIDTPTVAFVAAQPGIYRIDDDPTGTGSMVTVFRGSGTVYGENGVSRQVVAGTSYRFNDSALASVDVNGLPRPDDFDRFSETRDADYDRYAQQQQQYVPPDMIGGDDLYQYGQWNDTPDYGNVWYPTSVPAGWAPYRYGHWAWIDPWGWTWVDDQPWGFAPFHYGRWAYISDRWGWIPGPVDVQPVYAPALVAFIGGSGFSLSIGLGGPVGWFPLGPRDVYVPWFQASRNYFTNVNVTNIRNVYVNKTIINNIYNDYSTNRTVNINRYNRYAYRDMPNAVTAVPRNVFAEARPVHPAALRLNRTQLARAQVATTPRVVPATASLGVRRPTAQPALLRGRQPFARPVVARRPPPPRPVSFAARERVIEHQQGKPVSPGQMRDLQRAQPAGSARNDRVKLIPALAAGAAGAAAIAATRHGAAAPRPAEPSAGRAGPNATPFKNTARPMPTRNQPAQPTAPRPGELPSARFAHRGAPTTLPRAPVIRPAGEPQRTAPATGQLPVVKPVERAPQSMANPAAQQRQADLEAQQRMRTQQSQQQRQIQEQAQQRAQQQAQQQRAAQLQAQQRAREQEVQRQRQAEIQAQQRAQQMQQQRQAQMQTQQREQQMQQQREAGMQAQQRAREQAMQQQRAAQMQEQQRAMQMQQQQGREREIQRAPQPRNQPAPARREPPPSKRPPPSSGNN